MYQASGFFVCGNTSLHFPPPIYTYIATSLGDTTPILEIIQQSTLPLRGNN